MRTIEASFLLDRQVMAQAYANHRKVRRLPRLVASAGVLAAVWGLWLVAGEARTVAGGVTLGAGLLALLLPMVSRVGWLRAVEDNPFFGRQVSCQFTDEGFTMAAEGKGIRVPWDDIHKIVEGENGYLIYPRRGAFYYIPADGFATDIDADRVKGFFLSEKMRRN